MKADAKTEAAITAVLDKMVEAHAKRDFNGMLALFVPDPDLVLYGTGGDEKRVGLLEVKAQLERDWSQSEAGYWEPQWTSISSAGPVAWVAADCVSHWKVEGQEMTLLLRLTLVLEQRDGRWLCAHFHLSAPDRGQPKGKSFPTSIEAVAAAVQAERPDLRRHAAPDGTVTILFTDIQGSGAMTERLGDIRWLELLREHNTIVRQQVAAHGGFEVKSEGDGFMLAFQSARRGLRCAIGIQRVFAQRNDQAEEPMNVRIGLHTGEAIKEAEDFFGRHVILASRIADEAQGGQILVSSLLKELTESAGDIAFGERREVELKGLAGQHQVFEVRWQD